MTHDQLAPYEAANEWSGILVEPLPGPFERLRRTHAAHDDRLTLVNAAIAEGNGSRTVYYPYRVRDGEVIDRLDTLASLSREMAERTGAVFIPDGERAIAEEEVDAVSFASLVREHSLERLDLLAIDTEGHDHEVLMQVDLEGLRPRLLVYEHLLLTPEDRERCRDLVEGLGYETLAEQKDTWCLDPRDDALTQTFRRLKPRAPAESIDDWRS
jgi:FkbM family methyltransferase